MTRGRRRPQKRDPDSEPTPATWRIPVRNQLAMAHALGHYKRSVQLRLTDELLAWLAAEARALGITRSAYLGFLMDAVRPLVDTGSIDIKPAIQLMSPRWRAQMLDEPWDVATQLALQHFERFTAQAAGLKIESMSDDDAACS